MKDSIDYKLGELCSSVKSLHENVADIKDDVRGLDIKFDSSIQELRKTIASEKDKRQKDKLRFIAMIAGAGAGGSGIFTLVKELFIK